jgi:hypothetical protein
VIDIGKCCRVASVISAQYAADESLMAYSAIDLTPFGFSNRDVILADELGYKEIPVGLLVEEIATEELWEIYRGTRVVKNGPNEWKVDAMFRLDPCPFVAGARTERGFTTTEETFHLLSGQKWPTVQGVSGHSLAAAWALLRAAKCKTNLISFAGPRVGDHAFAAYAMRVIPMLLRWVNEPDVVPKLPLPVWPHFDYMHAGPAGALDSSGMLNPLLDFGSRAAAWHALSTYQHLLDPTYPLDPRFAPAA